MKHNKWMIACLACLVISAVPGGMGVALGVLACLGCASICFTKWLHEEDKFQKAEHEKSKRK